MNIKFRYMQAGVQLLLGHVEMPNRKVQTSGNQHRPLPIMLFYTHLQSRVPTPPTTPAAAEVMLQPLLAREAVFVQRGRTKSPLATLP